MGGHPAKRRKVEEEAPSPSYEITTADHLHALLQFRQSSDLQVNAGIDQFKSFLTDAAKNENLAAQSRQLQILREYCNQQTAADFEHVNFPDIFSTWSFAVENNNDAVISTVPAALAQFFKTISGSLEFRDFGLSLVHNLLKRDQLRLVIRGLSAPTSKPHLISPCLQLLTEMIDFDGGALASRIWGKRDVLLRRLDTLLAQQSKTSNAAERSKPSVRQMALRLVLAMLKLLDSNAKLELLTQERMLHACIHNLREDGDDVIVETLSNVDKHIIEDTEIPKPAKVKFFRAPTLSALGSLYLYEVDDYQEAIERVREATNQLLVKLCTSRNGIRLNENGWYPPGTYDNNLTEKEDGMLDLGLDSPSYSDDYTKNVPLKNIELAIFLKGLRPAQDPMQSSLLLEIFRAAPELVANYFIKHSRFSTGPKDDPVWRGQFATYFSVVQLPVPETLGRSEDVPTRPPPLTIAIESILPRPFEHGTLTKLLNSSDDIMIISGSRLMTIALGKLQNVLNFFSTYSTSKPALWQQASHRLIQLFISRVPTLKDVIAALQRTPTENEAVRNAVLECLSAFYKLLPEAIAGSNFDIGPVMMDLISLLESHDTERGYLMEQLAHCVVIADLSPATKWFSKPDNDCLSPLGRLLKLAIRNEDIEESKNIIASIMAVLETKGIINSETKASKALISSVQTTKKVELSAQTFLFLDNCICRTNQRPVKYLDLIESQQQLVSDKKSLSLLAVCIPEQWEFAMKKYAEETEILKNIAGWIIRFYAALDVAGENFRVMNQFQDQMMQASSEKLTRQFEKAIEKSRKKPVVLADNTINESKLASAATSNGTELATNQTQVDLNSIFDQPTSPPSSLEGLDRWNKNTDIELEIHSGRLSKLMYCISSPEEEIRRQTFQLLQNIAYIIDSSSSSVPNEPSNTTYNRNAVPSETGQIYLLLGEVCETVRQYGLSSPLPTLVPELAIRMLSVLTNPLHQLFSKANKFLLHGPSWNPRRLIPYWVHWILLHEPESGDSEDVWVEEVNWLLGYLVAGLSTPGDAEIYRRSGVWERVLSLYSKPGLQRGTKKLVLNMLWRDCIVQGGADTLWTRYGVHSWLEMMVHMERDELCRKILEQVKTVLEENCDKDGIEKWKGNRPILRKAMKG